MSFLFVYRLQKEHSVFTPEEKFMAESGIRVGRKADDDATLILFRGAICRKPEDYPSDRRALHTAQEHFDHLYLPRWYPLISDLTMETLFVDDLDERAVSLVESHGWPRAFIKDWVKSVAYPDLNDTVWPNSSMEDIKQRLQEHSHGLGFCLRKFVEPEKLENETRFWVMNGNIYSSVADPFPIVTEAVRRLQKLGGRLYVIDATPDVIIEINPGESSDRGAKNRLEDFAGWVRTEFCSP